MELSTTVRHLRSQINYQRFSLLVEEMNSVKCFALSCFFLSCPRIFKMIFIGLAGDWTPFLSSYLALFAINKATPSMLLSCMMRDTISISNRFVEYNNAIMVMLLTQIFSVKEFCSHVSGMIVDAYAGWVTIIPGNKSYTLVMNQESTKFIDCVFYSHFLKPVFLAGTPSLSTYQSLHHRFSNNVVVSEKVNHSTYIFRALMLAEYWILCDPFHVIKALFDSELMIFVANSLIIHEFIGGYVTDRDFNGLCYVYNSTDLLRFLMFNMCSMYHELSFLSMLCGYPGGTAASFKCSVLLPANFKRMIHTTHSNIKNGFRRWNSGELVEKFHIVTGVVLCEPGTTNLTYTPRHGAADLFSHIPMSDDIYEYPVSCIYPPFIDDFFATIPKALSQEYNSELSRYNLSKFSIAVRHSETQTSVFIPTGVFIQPSLSSPFCIPSVLAPVVNSKSIIEYEMGRPVKQLVLYSNAELFNCRNRDHTPISANYYDKIKDFGITIRTYRKYPKVSLEAYINIISTGILIDLEDMITNFEIVQDIEKGSYEYDMLTHAKGLLFTKVIESMSKKPMSLEEAKSLFDKLSIHIFDSDSGDAHN